MEGPTLLLLQTCMQVSLAIIMDRYGGPHSALTIALNGGLYLAIITDRYRGPHTALTIALHGGM
jgi:hypothetical protein